MVGRVMDIPPEKTFPKNRRNFCFELMLPFALKTRNFSFFLKPFTKIAMLLIGKLQNMHLKIVFICFIPDECNFNVVVALLRFQRIVIFNIYELFSRETIEKKGNYQD